MLNLSRDYHVNLEYSINVIEQIGNSLYLIGLEV